MSAPSPGVHGLAGGAGKRALANAGGLSMLLAALPGVALVVAVNRVAYAKLGLPGAEQLRRPRR